MPIIWSLRSSLAGNGANGDGANGTPALHRAIAHLVTGCPPRLARRCWPCSPGMFAQRHVQSWTLFGVTEDGHFISRFNDAPAEGPFFIRFWVRALWFPGESFAGWRVGPQNVRGGGRFQNIPVCDTNDGRLYAFDPSKLPLVELPVIDAQRVRCDSISPATIFNGDYHDLGAG